MAVRALHIVTSAIQNCDNNIFVVYIITKAQKLEKSKKIHTLMRVHTIAYYKLLLNQQNVHFTTCMYKVIIFQSVLNA